MKTKTIPHNRVERRPITVTIPTPDGRRVAERIEVKVPMRWDAGLGTWLINADAMAEVEAARYRHMGLMLPAEMQALRERLGLTQKRMGELLRIGDKSWTRWESGLQRQSQSINLLLKLLDSGIVTPTQMAQIGAEPADWSRQFLRIAEAPADDKPVALDGLLTPRPAEVVEPEAIPA